MKKTVLIKEKLKFHEKVANESVLDGLRVPVPVALTDARNQRYPDFEHSI